MRWRPTARFLCLVLALPGLIGSTAAMAARSGQPGAVARVRVWTYMTGPIDPADRDRFDRGCQRAPRDSRSDRGLASVRRAWCVRERERDGSRA